MSSIPMCHSDAVQVPTITLATERRQVRDTFAEKHGRRFRPVDMWCRLAANWRWSSHYSRRIERSRRAEPRRTSCLE